MRVFDLAGRHVRDVALPGFGTVAGFEGKRNEHETFYAFTSFNTPATIYRYDVPSGASKLWGQPALRFDPRNYLTMQVFYTSKDGTKIPMFLSRKNAPKRRPPPPDALVRLRRLQGFADSILQSRRSGLDGDGRALCSAQPARRRRVW